MATFIGRNIGHERRAPRTKIPTRYSKIVPDLNGLEGQRARTGEELKLLYERVKDFKWMLVDSFDVHCDFGCIRSTNTLLTT